MRVILWVFLDLLNKQFLNIKCFNWFFITVLETPLAVFFSSPVQYIFGRSPTNSWNGTPRQYFWREFFYLIWFDLELNFIMCRNWTFSEIYYCADITCSFVLKLQNHFFVGVVMEGMAGVIIGQVKKVTVPGHVPF